MNTTRLLAIAVLMLGVCSGASAENKANANKVTIYFNNKSDKAISANLFKHIDDPTEVHKPVWEIGIRNLKAGGSAKLEKNIGAGKYKLDVCNSSNDFSSCNRETTIEVHKNQGKEAFSFDITNDGIKEVE